MGVLIPASLRTVGAFTGSGSNQVLNSYSTRKDGDKPMMHLFALTLLQLGIATGNGLLIATAAQLLAQYPM
jgi:hypothetical protein